MASFDHSMDHVICCLEKRSPKWRLFRDTLFVITWKNAGEPVVLSAQLASLCFTCLFAFNSGYKSINVVPSLRPSALLEPVYIDGFEKIISCASGPITR